MMSARRRGGTGSARARRSSSYRLRRDGNWPATCARSSICSGAVRNWTSAQAASGWRVRALIASCAPPSAAADRPPPRAASARRQIVRRLANPRGSLMQRRRVRPVAQEHRLPVLKCEAGLLLLPVSTASGATIPTVIASRMKVSARIASGESTTTRPSSSRIASAEAGEVLEKDRDEALVAGALPDEAIAHVARPRARAGTSARSASNVAGRAPDQIGAPVEHPRVDEPRYGVELSVPAIGGHRGRKEARVRGVMPEVDRAAESSRRRRTRASR